MTFLEILTELAGDEGFSLSVPAQKTYLTRVINKAAEDIYNGHDLKGWIREQYFYFDKDAQLITFPWQVNQLKAIRNVDQYMSIGTTSMEPRYREYEWPMQLQTWRVIKEGPLQLSMSDASPLTFTLPEVADADIDIFVIGGTNKAHRIQESLTISEGEISVTTQGIFEPNKVEALYKPFASSQDITVTDDLGTELAKIPNVCLKSKYLTVQAFDIYYKESENPLIEALYKHSFVPFVNDYDVFIAGERHHNAIYHVARAILLSKDEKRKADAGTYLNTAEGLIADANNDQKSEEIVTMISSHNPIQRALENPDRGFFVPRRSQK